MDLGNGRCLKKDIEHKQGPLAICMKLKMPLSDKTYYGNTKNLSEPKVLLVFKLGISNQDHQISETHSLSQSSEWYKQDITLLGKGEILLNNTKQQQEK